MREVLLDRAHDGGAAGIGQQMKRLPETERGVSSGREPMSGPRVVA
jgi:hypothetical protein